MPSRLAEKIFFALPAFRNAGATVYGLMLEHERYGDHYRQALNRIRERETWTSGQMLEYQDRRLREIVEIAFRHVPYYRETFRKLGLSPADFRSARDLQKLPILEKEALRADPTRFLDERLDRSRLMVETTSGTTGTAIRIFTTPRACQEHYAFFEARCRRVAGLRYGEDPHVTFGVKRVVPPERETPPFWCYNHAGKQLYMSVFHLADRNLAHYCEALRHRPYRALVGYGSAMATIGRYILDENIRGIRIPLAITSGETLLASQRDTIERAFGCRVFDQYGCTELAFFGAEGACGRMHLSPDYSVLEIVDDAGDPLPPGKPGHVLGTSLINDAQILLRYRVGDVATLDAKPCGCGSPLPVLRSIEGRAMNAIILPDGHRLYRIGDVASQIPSVKQCQIVQEEIGVFTIYVVAAKGFGQSEAEQVAANFSASVGRARIQVEVVDRIRRGPGRKSATVISKVAAPDLPRQAEESDSAEGLTVVVYSGESSRRFDCTRRTTIAEFIRAAAEGFGIAHGDRLLLAPAASPGTALLPERTLDSYGIRDGMALVLTAVGTPACYRQGAHNGSPDDTPIAR
jgi:phenylacetate-CoA ligase